MAQSYVVKPGDNLSSIGARYGVSYQEIAKANKIADPNKIYPGQTFTIPDKPGSVPAPTPQTNPQPNYSTPQPVQSSPVQSSSGVTPEGIPISSLPPDLVYNGTLDVSNPVKKAKYDQIVSQRRTSQPQSAASAMTGFNQPTIDLPSIYQKLYETSSIKDTQAQFDTITGQVQERERAKNAAIAKINDNPFYSEATRVGRIAKIEQAFNNDVQALTGQQRSLQDKIATSKADIETQLNLQTKQFDITSQQARQSLDQFNTMLGLGAFDNATGEDIANITRATGLTSGFIQSAIDANKKKNVQTQIIQVDDGQNVNAVVIDSNTGNVINTSVIGKSKPKEKAATADEKAEAGNFTNAQKSKAIKFLAEADVATNPDDAGDKLLSAQEQQQALLKIQSEIVADPDKAFALFQEAFTSGGFGGWTP